jgi:hypothetical protein
MPSRGRYHMRRERNRVRLQDPAQQERDLGKWLQKLHLAERIRFRQKVGSLTQFVFMRDGIPITRGVTFREAKLFMQGLENALRLVHGRNWDEMPEVRNV